MAAIANLIIDQGANFSSDITVKDANGNAFNLTGYTTEAPERYVYDVEITQTSTGTVTRVIEGIISVRPNVTT